MRLFVGIKVSDLVQKSVDDFKKRVSRFSEMEKKARWTQSENLHFTLKFFGEIEEDRLENLQISLLESVRNQTRFSLEVKGLGFFPSFHHARILWLGVTDGSDQLEKLAESLEKSSTFAGFKPADKPFSSHLTIARFPLPPSTNLLRELKGTDSLLFGRMSVDRIHLIQTVLNPSGPIYTHLKEFPF